MDSWEYERWDGQQRTLVHFDPTPVEYEPDIDARDTIVDLLHVVIIRILFPRGMPWLG